MNAPIKPNQHAPARGDLGRLTEDGWRSAGPTYQEILDADTVQPVRDIYRRQSIFEPGVMRVPVERYISKEVHLEEVEKIWKKVWQIACRDEDIPNVGDYIVYDVADFSYIVVRTGENEFKALRNACLHRGRKLKEQPGKAKEFRCFFHGWSWEINGDLKNLTCPWDFPDLNAENSKLPQAKVGTWQNWVFINPDPDAAPLEDFLGELDQHFQGPHRQDRRYKRAHVIKEMRCNWKIAQEAFMEAYHVVITHPHMAASNSDSNTQYDVFGNFSRAINPSNLQSPHINGELTAQDILNNAVDVQALESGDAAQNFVLPEGVTARAYMAQAMREDLRVVWGEEVDTMNDADFDSAFFTVFPNFHPWSGFSRINYRFRPYGNDPDMCLMEVIMLEPYDTSKPRPKAAAIQYVDADTDVSEATTLGGLARVFQQDAVNLPRIQLGMKAMNVPGAKAQVQFSSYQESKIRHFHTLWNKWMGVEG